MLSLKNKVVILLLSLGLVFPVIGEAQEPSFTVDSAELSLYRLPEGRRCKVEGVTYQCFNLEEYKELLRMDTDLQHVVEQNEALKDTIRSLYGLVDELRLQLDEKDEQIDILSNERDRLFGKWKEENKLRLEAENKPALGNWIAWGTAAAEAGVILGLVLALILGGS